MRGQAEHDFSGYFPDMEVSALPMVMSVTMGASSSFLTPFANGVSLMVYGPGGFKFGDFWPSAWSC